MSSTDATQCPRCGQWTSASSRFCGQCGGDLADAVELFSDPNALDSAATSAPQGSDRFAYGTSIGTSPLGPGPLSGAGSPLSEPAGDHTQYRPGATETPTGPLVYVAPPTPSSNQGLKIAIGVVGALILVCAVLVTVLVVGGSNTSTPTTTVAAAPVVPSTPSTTGITTTVTTAVSTTQITLPTSTTNPRVVGNDLGAAHAGSIEKLDLFYQAIVRSDWDYTRAHFINAEGRGPNESNEWWQSQYGTIEEYWLAPVRVSGGVYWIGLVTHENGPAGPYSYQFCIPFAVSAEGFVRQTDKAVTRLTRKTDGSWIDPQQGVAPLLSC